MQCIKVTGTISDPTARSMQSMTYFPEKNVTLMFGGQGDPDTNKKDIIYPNNDLFVLNLTNHNRWQAVTTTGSIPSPRCGHTATLIQGRVLVWGGRGQTQLCDGSAFLLDWQKREWSEVTVTGTAPASRFQHIACAFGSKLYIFGGHDGRKICFHDLHTLDLDASTATGRWEQIKLAGEVPKLSGASSGVVWKNRLVVFGGSNSREFSNDVFVFVPETATWARVEATGCVPPGRAAHTACVVNDRVFLFGGSNGNMRLNDLHVLDLTENGDGVWTATWARFPLIGDVPEGRSLQSMVVDRDGNMYLYGGWNGSMCFADLFVLTFYSPPAPSSASAAPFEALFMSETLADCFLECEGHRVPAHKSVLYCRSTLFQSWMAFWPQGSDIHIPDITFEVLMIVLRYIYTNKTSIRHEVAEDVLLVADKFNLPGLKLLAARELVAGMRVATVERCHELGGMMEIAHLRQAACLFWYYNQQQLCEHKKAMGNMTSEDALLFSSSESDVAALSSKLTTTAAHKRSRDASGDTPTSKRVSVAVAPPSLHSPATPIPAFAALGDA